MNAFEMSASIYQPWLPMDVPKNESRRGREIGDTLHQQALFSECLRPLPIFWAPAAACPKPVQHQPIFLLKLKMPSQDEQWMCTSQYLRSVLAKMRSWHEAESSNEKCPSCNFSGITNLSFVLGVREPTKRGILYVSSCTIVLCSKDICAQFCNNFLFKRPFKSQTSLMLNNNKDP